MAVHQILLKSPIVRIRLVTERFIESVSISLIRVCDEHDVTAVVIDGVSLYRPHQSRSNAPAPLILLDNDVLDHQETLAVAIELPHR